MRKPMMLTKAARAKIRKMPKNARPKTSTQSRKNSAQKVAAKTPALAGIRPPLPGQGKRGESGHLGYLLRQAQAAARLTVERALADLGVTSPQFAVLTMLKAYPGLSGADLARVALLTPQTVGQIIRNLERAGAILKTPHPVHGRVLQWTLTRRGTTLLGRCRRRVAAVERRIAAGLTARNEAVVRRWLSAVAVLLA